MRLVQNLTLSFQYECKKSINKVRTNLEFKVQEAAYIEPGIGLPEGF